MVASAKLHWAVGIGTHLCRRVFQGILFLPSVLRNPGRQGDLADRSRGIRGLLWGLVGPWDRAVLGDPSVLVRQGTPWGLSLPSLLLVPEDLCKCFGKESKKIGELLLIV